MLLLILSFFALAATQYLSARNLSMLIIEFSITSVLALGMLLVSSELPELLGLSDRVLVLGGGQLRGEFPRHAATPEALLRAALPSADAELGRAPAKDLAQNREMSP